jgi:hypothetical protein
MTRTSIDVQVVCGAVSVGLGDGDGTCVGGAEVGGLDVVGAGVELCEMVGSVGFGCGDVVGGDVVGGGVTTSEGVVRGPTALWVDPELVHAASNVSAAMDATPTLTNRSAGRWSTAGSSP